VFTERYSFYDDFNVKSKLTPAQLEVYEQKFKDLRSRFEWSQGLEKVYEVCLVHKSINVPGKIQYFSSVDNLMANKPTRTSPEMFLHRFLATATDEIKASWEAEVLGAVLPEIKFVENTDPDGWEQVYAEGPSSCMKRRGRQVRQYAHPKNNLALAYCVDEHDEIICRTIVNKKTMCWVRIFGDDASFFAAALSKLGFKRDADAALIGETIHLVYEQCSHVNDDDESCTNEVLVGPYLDCDTKDVAPIPDGSSSGVIVECGETLEYEEGDDGYVCGDHC
jgi:hypothetical protein